MHVFLSCYWLVTCVGKFECYFLCLYLGLDLSRYKLAFFFLLQNIKIDVLIMKSLI